MKYMFEAIRIDEKILSEKTNEISCMYMIKMDFDSLIEICGVGNVSINRVVDEYRAEKMKKYIRDKQTFYPPLIVATTKKNLIIYDEEKKIIKIDKDKLIKNKDMLVIDGQHRYTSIKLLKEESENLIKGRYQSIFLIDNINEFQQRKIFVDINDNAKKVSTGTKLRLDKTLINYISLMLVDNNEIVQKRVSMDANQTNSIDNIPYKFIIRGNERLAKKIDADYESALINIDSVDKTLEFLYIIWNEIFTIIEDEESKKYKVLTNEVFYTSVCTVIEKIFITSVYNNVLSKDQINKEEFIVKIKNIFSLIKRNMVEIDEKYYSKELNSTKERYEKLLEEINILVNEG